MEGEIGYWGLMIWLSIMIAVIGGSWKVFEKAGQPGWAILIPFYNIYVMLQIVGRPGWWLLLLFIPFVNAIILILVYIDLAHSFGKSSAFGLGLFFLGVIFLPILGFGDAEYEGPSVESL